MFFKSLAPAGRVLFDSGKKLIVFALILLLLTGCSQEESVDKLIRNIPDGGSFNESAIVRLINIGGPAVEPLIEALENDDWMIRVGARFALGKIGDPRAIDPLIEILLDHDHIDAGGHKSGYEDAVEALVDIGEPAIEPLINAYDKVPYDVKDLIVNALVEMGEPAIEPLIASISNEISDEDFIFNDLAYRALVEMGEPALDYLASALQEEDAVTQVYIIQILQYRVSSDHLLELLIGALTDSDPEVRSSAAIAMRAIGDHRAVEPLIDALQDSDPEVRLSVVYALGGIDDPRAIEPIIGTLKDSEPEVRIGAVNALHGMDDPRKIEPLIGALKDSNTEVRLSAVIALSEIDDPRTIESLIGALKDSNSEVRSSAANSLSKIGDAAVEPTLRAIRRDITIVPEIYNFIIKIGEPGTETILINALLRYNDKGMATAFINSGNSQLEEEGRNWAEKNGYNIMKMPSFGNKTAWGGE